MHSCKIIWDVCIQQGETLGVDYIAYIILDCVIRISHINYFLYVYTHIEQYNNGRSIIKPQNYNWWWCVRKFKAIIMIII